MRFYRYLVSLLRWLPLYADATAIENEYEGTDAVPCCAQFAISNVALRPTLTKEELFMLPFAVPLRLHAKHVHTLFRIKVPKEHHSAKLCFRLLRESDEVHLILRDLNKKIIQRMELHETEIEQQFSDAFSHKTIYVQLVAPSASINDLIEILGLAISSESHVLDRALTEMVEVKKEKPIKSLPSIYYKKQFPDIYKSASNVVRIVIYPEDKVHYRQCTAWIMANQYLMTTYECIPDQETANHAMISFKHEMRFVFGDSLFQYGTFLRLGLQAGHKTAEDSTDYLVTLVRGDPIVNVSILKLPKKVSDDVSAFLATLTPLRISLSKPRVASNIYIPIHPKFRWKRIMYMNAERILSIQSVKYDFSKHIYRVHYEGGEALASRGAPVISTADHRVIALHSYDEQRVPRKIFGFELNWFCTTKYNITSVSTHSIIQSKVLRDLWVKIYERDTDFLEELTNHFNSRPKIRRIDSIRIKSLDKDSDPMDIDLEKKRSIEKLNPDENAHLPMQRAKKVKSENSSPKPGHVRVKTKVGVSSTSSLQIKSKVGHFRMSVFEGGSPSRPRNIKHGTNEEEVRAPKKQRNSRA